MKCVSAAATMCLPTWAIATAASGKIMTLKNCEKWWW